MISNLVSRIRNEVAQAFEPFCASTEDGATGVVLAVSGGADSLCLADATLAIAPRLRLRPLIAHLDHGLRGEASAADAEFVCAFAAERSVPCVVERADVNALAREHKLSIEVAAREARYRFLARVAEAHGTRLVALAHHADDQAETVLLRLIRGTGLQGLRGMQTHDALPTAPHLTAVRPLLRTSRAEIEQYCRERKLLPRHDATNDALDHTRNRIRHELLPFLERYNPNIRMTLTRLADTVAADVEIVEQATQAAFERVAQLSPEGIAVDRPAWCALPRGLQRAILREAVRRLQGDVTGLQYAAIEEARDVLNSDAPTGEIALMHDVRIEVTKRTFIVRKSPV
ncbi:MAG: tRNA lysidine(34) synthetase TilS [Candidatus Brachytrichaceae bacterium NZ_4S206]